MSKFIFPSETMAETHFALRGGKAITVNNSLKRLMNGMTALAVAASLVLASAAPSHADRRGDNLAKALAAAIVLGLIVNNAGKGKGNAHPAPPPLPPKPVPVKHPRVPGVCAIEIDSDEGNAVTVFSESCLRDEGFDYRLPDCARSVRIYGQRDRVYSAQCLRDAGFRVTGY